MVALTCTSGAILKGLSSKEAIASQFQQLAIPAERFAISAIARILN